MTIEPTPTRPLDRRKIYEQVADQLLGLITSRLLTPGDAIPPARELTEAFSVGRSSIREALRVLESQGVITAKPGGTFVVASASNPLNASLQLVVALGDSTSLRDLFELRRLIECEAAALAARRRSDAHVERMNEAITAMEAALATSNRADAFITADMRFHLTIADATGNRLIAYAMEAARDMLRTAIVAVVSVPESPERAVVEHRAIRDAIVAGDAAASRASMDGHLGRVERDAERGKQNG
jgi:GntR family transcriptional repressor for pyruvate dehydrogenase complex